MSVRQNSSCVMYTIQTCRVVRNGPTQCWYNTRHHVYELLNNSCNLDTMQHAESAYSLEPQSTTWAKHRCTRLSYQCLQPKWLPLCIEQQLYDHFWLQLKIPKQKFWNKTDNINSVAVIPCWYIACWCVGLPTRWIVDTAVCWQGCLVARLLACAVYCCSCWLLMPLLAGAATCRHAYLTTLLLAGIIPSRYFRLLTRLLAGIVACWYCWVATRLLAEIVVRFFVFNLHVVW